MSFFATIFSTHYLKHFGRHGLTFFVLFSFFVAAISLRGHEVVSLLAAATSSIYGDRAIVYFSSSHASLLVGDSTEIDVDVDSPFPINAVGVTIKFDPALLEVIGISKAKSFLDLWTEETVIREDVGEVHFSGGTVRKGGLTGLATMLTVELRAKKSGLAELSFSDADILASNGLGESVKTNRRTLPLNIAETSFSTGGASSSLVQSPTTGFGTGSVSLIDMSIFTLRLFGPYNPKYDINNDGRLNLSDLSAFFTFTTFPKNR